MSGGSKKVTVGYWYRMLFGYGWCKGPIDAFLELRGGGRTAWKGVVTQTSRIYVNALNLWGGEKKEGGLQGYFDVQLGEADQGVNDYLQTRLGRDQPTYRGKAIGVWRGGRYGAMNPYPKRLEFKVRRILRGWDGDECWYAEKAGIWVVPNQAFIEDLAFPATAAGAGSYAGIVLTGGFDSNDTLVIDKVPGMRYRAWSPWNSDSDGNAAGKPWTNTFSVTAGGATAQYWPEFFSTPETAESAAARQRIQISGHSVYTIWMYDIPVNDNRGGLSLRVYKNGTLGMNPAHILYDSLTAGDMQGEPAGMINQESFIAAADKLFDEGFGLCTTYDPDAETIEEFQQRVCNVIGASLTQSRINGQYYLDLIRGDDTEDLLIITADDIIELKWEPVPLTELVNQITVEWFDPERKEHRSTPPVQSLGAIQAAGKVIPEVMRYPEIPTEDLALRVAARDLQARSTPLTRFALTANRRRGIWALRPGQRFRLQSPQDGFADIVCVLGDIDVGTLTSGRITIKAVQDVFGMPDTVYVEAEAGQAPPQNLPPAASPHQRLIEAPYVELVANMSGSELAAFPDDAGAIMAMASQPLSGLNYSLWSGAEGTELEDNGSGDWCPVARVVEEADYLDTEFTLTAGSNLEDIVVGSWALWDEEIVRVDAIDLDALTLTIGRGCADTVPHKHDANSLIYFCGDWGATDDVQYVDGETVTAKLLTRTSSAELSIDEAAELAVDMNHRQHRPYPPSRVRINGQAYPDVVSGDLVVEWAWRDRLMQADKLIDHNAGSIGPEPGTTLSAFFYLNGNLDHSEHEAVASPIVYSPSGEGNIRVELETIRDGVAAHQRFIHVAQRGSAPWTPEYLTKAPEIWLDDESDMQVIAEAVAEWANKGTAGGVFSQSSAGARPFALDDSVVGRRVVTFDGTDDVLVASSGPIRDVFRNTGAGWAFAVYARTERRIGYHQVFEVSTAGSVTRFGVGVLDDESYVAARRLDSSGAQLLIDEIEQPDKDFHFQYGHILWSSAEARVQTDGKAATTTGGFLTAGVTQNTASSRMVLGCSAGLVAFAPVKIAAVIGGSGSLPSESEIQKLEGWAAHRYGLTGNLPESHPYKGAPPLL